MALLFMEGFDHFTTVQANRKWSAVTGGNIVSPGCYGGQAWQFTDAGSNGTYLEQVIPQRSVYVVGFHWRIDAGDSTQPIFAFMDGSTVQLDLRITSDAAFQVLRGGSTVLATSSASRVAFGYYNFIEFKAFIDGTTGYIIVRVNGVEIINVPSLNTKQSANGWVNKMRFLSYNSGTYDIRLDNIYLNDTTGVRNNGFNGECRVESHSANTNGTNDFAAYGAGSNHAAVGETICDDDATYTHGATIGQKDTYLVSPFSFVGTIFGVQVDVTHRKDDVGSRTIAPIVKSGTNFYEGTQDSATSQYRTAKYIWELDPNTGNPWTESAINAAQFGLTIKS